MSARRYSIHGLLVESEIPLGDAASDDGAPADLTLRRTAEPLPVVAGAELVAERRESKQFQAWRDAEGFTLVLSDVCSFRLDLARRCVHLHERAGLPEELATLLVSGVLLPFVLSLSGGLVLHASAIELDGVLFAVAGPSGVGKSTLAALACVGGAQPFADDALRVEQRESGWVGHQGVRALRLRERAWSIGALVAGESRHSVDGRLSTTAHAEPTSTCVPLERILLPRHRQTPGPVQLEVAPRAMAALELLKSLRVGSWLSSAILEQQTRAVAALVRYVPVVFLRVPRFERFDGEAAKGLVAALRGRS